MHGRILISVFPIDREEAGSQVPEGSSYGTLLLAVCGFRSPSIISYPSSQSSQRRLPWVSCSPSNYSSDLTHLLFSLQVLKVVLCKVLEAMQLPFC